jgi:hypothetical protein
MWLRQHYPPAEVNGLVVPSRDHRSIDCESTITRDGTVDDHIIPI